MSRTDFEAAYIERYGHRPRGWNDDFHVYQDAHANGAWFGWQAGAAGIEAKAAPVGVPVYQLHCREIGEGDWCPADLRHYTYCQRAPEMDTRIVEVQQAGAAYQRQSGVANEAEGSAAQKAFWSGFESASLRLFGTDIRAAWNNYKASDEFARLNGAGSHE